ncbi:MAG: alkaline phosphatase family protein [Spirochaetaceae bacterium]|nr:alkaline phosphatase family protein [Spirochaetaceae bacterium]
MSEANFTRRVIGQAGLVEEALADGRLRLPSPAAPSFVDLVNALHRGAGVPVASTPHGDKLAAHLFDRDHLVIVLVDGMGMAALDEPGYADLRGRVRMELDSVFPATTACAITTVATGLWPGRHGVPGWYGYLQERDLSVTVLRYTERHTGRALKRFGVELGDLWSEPSRFADATGDMEIHMPWRYVRSTFNRYLSGRCRARGYRSLRQAARRIRSRSRRLQRRRKRAVTFWYIPHYDTLCHDHGVVSTQARSLLGDLQGMLLELASALPDGARMALTADHGLIDLNRDQKVTIFDGDPLLDCLRAVPSGEGRTPHFHVRPGRGPELVERLTDRCGGRMAVLSLDEAEEMRLFGPEPLSDHARRRFGDYIGVTLEPLSVGYHQSEDDFGLRNVGIHGGMSPDEVRIPLIVL